MADIAIVDYGMGNLRSVQQALRTVAPNASIVVTGDPREVAQATRVVFPGQGAMPDCMRELDARGLRAAVLEAATAKPFLGICIGLQMLFEHSAEGDIPGLGVLKGSVVRFASNLRDEQGNKLKVPHMGWNQVHHGRRILCGMALHRTRGFISCTVTMCSRRMRSLHRPPVIIRSPSPVLWRVVICLPCSSTRKRARVPG